MYDSISPFCSDEDRDTFCPLPSVPKPHGSKSGTPNLYQEAITGTKVKSTESEATVKENAKKRRVTKKNRVFESCCLVAYLECMLMY